MNATTKYLEDDPEVKAFTKEYKALQAKIQAAQDLFDRTIKSYRNLMQGLLVRAAQDKMVLGGDGQEALKEPQEKLSKLF